MSVKLHYHMYLKPAWPSPPVSPFCRFCVEAALQHRERLASSWDCLPKHLLHCLQQRIGDLNTLGS